MNMTKTKIFKHNFFQNNVMNKFFNVIIGKF